MKIFFLIVCAALLAPGLLSAQEMQNTLRLAQSFEQAGEYGRASRLYEDLLRSDSLNFVYFEGLSRCYEQLKNYDAAIALDINRLRLEPPDHIDIARCYIRVTKCYNFGESPAPSRPAAAPPSPASARL